MATQPLKRKFTGKDVNMLTACATIVDNAISHKAFLVSKRDNWKDPFLPDLKKQIDSAFSEILGVDSARDMRNATQILLGIQTTALNDLAEFKVQLLEDFKNNIIKRDEILNNLGFTQHNTASRKKDQQALIELLLKFKKNMTSSLQSEITKAGTSVKLIKNIIASADVLNKSNITQETFKGSRKTVTQNGIKELNGIYDSVTSIAKISTNFFKDNLAAQSQFSYNKAINSISQPKTVVVKDENTKKLSPAIQSGVSN